LPNGLTLASTGEISGTPTAGGNASFTVRAHNSQGDDFRNYSFYVKTSADPVAPALDTQATELEAYENIQFEFQLEATGSSLEFTLESGSVLPDGLILEAATGKISGKPLFGTAADMPGGLYTLKIIVSNSLGNDGPTEFPLTVHPTLLPPVLTPTAGALPTTVGTSPFNLTATFAEAVTFEEDDITVTGGRPVSVTPANATGTSPSEVWTFDVLPDRTNPDGTQIEVLVKKGAAQSASGASTYMASSPVSVPYYYDEPVASLHLLDGLVFSTDPEQFSFDITAHGSGGSSDLYVGGQPANSDNIDPALEIRRNGAPFSGWDATLSGNRITVEGAFGQGDYEVALKANRIANNLGKFLASQTIRFSVQLSKNWYEGCPQTFTQSFAVLTADQEIGISYLGLAQEYLTADGGGALPTRMTLPAGQTELTFAFRTIAVPEGLEGETGAVVITANALPVATYQFKLYNRPQTEDVIFIPPTTRYPGFFKLVRGGSPALERSFDGGQQWSNVWTQATDLELSTADGEIILREPDGCEELVVSLDVSISTTIRRAIFLPAVANIVTAPGTGEHAVFSGGDFVFQVSMTGPLANRKPIVTTDRKYVPDSVGVIVEPNDDGSFAVQLRAVREPVHVSLAAGDLLTGSAAVEGTQVWTSDGQLYISSAGNDEARVYTLTGALLKTVAVAAGQTVRTALPPGFFVVRLDSGRTFKVSGL
jgi:hypothetical protein